MFWQKVVLRSLCEITSSKRIYVADYQSDGIPFYRGREISEKYKGNLDVSTELFISESKYREIKEKFGVPVPGDLLLTSVGTLGNPYVVQKGEIFYFKDGNLTWFRNFKELDSKFLFYWLVSPQGKAELKKCTIGSSQSAYTIVLLKDMQIELPPLPIQRKIADVLSAYDDLIEVNARRIRILEQMAQSLYREWFGKVDTRSLPEGWEIMTVRDIANMYRGRSYGSDNLIEEGGLPFLNLKCLERDGGFRPDGLKWYKGVFKESQTALWVLLI
jgi:type I restriction enzyme S subunit